MNRLQLREVRMESSNGCHFLLITILSTIFSPIIAGDTLTPTGSLTDIAGDTLVSAGGIFELGFFSPGAPKDRYIGIWYKKIPVQTVVWVANRDRPVTNGTGVLKLSGNGSLVLVDGENTLVWSSDESGTTTSPLAQLLDSGNLVLRDRSAPSSHRYLWQSFDCPTGTWLPGMRIRPESRNANCFTSWRTPQDPSPGDYFVEMGSGNGLPEILTWERRRPPVRKYRTGPWNGLWFSGIPEMKSYDMFNFTTVASDVAGDGRLSFVFELKIKLFVARIVLGPTGLLQNYVWIDRAGAWNVFCAVPKDQCDEYAHCGTSGVCNSNGSPACSCMQGFRPKSPDEWYLRDYSQGCVRSTELDCGSDGFVKMGRVKLPDTTNSTVVGLNMSIEECKDKCLKNCSCTAYSSADIRGGGSGCVIWVGDLVDLKQYTDDFGQDLFVRMAASELLDPAGTNPRKQKHVVAIVTTATVLGLAILVVCGVFLCRRKKRVKKKTLKQTSRGFYYDIEHSTASEPEVPFLDLDTISLATDNFSSENKLGEGGFGCVYKGILEDGQEVAVKRLSRISVQGLDEFKNEVMLIAKLQHRNLVKLLGWSIQGEERMLIYEYMQNKSLDVFIFDQTRSALLDWGKRFNIILGIARGLLYLHHDSRFKIIHRDLKAGNVLLDGEMNPRISDFGTARLFGTDQMEENTRRVVGTYGYMSPEYAMDGIFSVKSDVFSFGVLVLEIVSGKKNRGTYQPEPRLNLLGHAWKLWKEGNCLELIDEAMRSTCFISEALRCIQVGLLCVQEHPEDRPPMTSVVFMLGSENSRLPQPEKPGFCSGGIPTTSDWSSSGRELCSVNEVTVTIIEGR